MFRRGVLILAVAVAGLLGCDEDDPDGADDVSEGREPITVTVMTQNVDIGPDVTDVLEASSLAELPEIVDRLYAELLASDFPARAELIADEVAAARPVVVGLQEVVLLRTQTPGDVTTARSTPATEVVVDYLQILLDALDRRGLAYRAAAVVDTMDVEVPSTTGDVRLTDREVLLASADVTTTDLETRNVSRAVDVEGPGGRPLRFGRGWVAMDVYIGDRKLFRVGSTHLEGANPPWKGLIQRSQAREISDEMETWGGRLVLMGDFNSAADRSTSTTYGMLVDDGWIDAWAQVNPQDAGFTCCRALDDPQPMLSRRIDHLFIQGGNGFRAQAAERHGFENSSRTPSGLWPADHVGVSVRLAVP